MAESGMGFVRGGEHTDAPAAVKQPASSVVILAPKQSKQQAEEAALARPISNILGIRRVLQQRTAAAGGRAASPDPLPRRRASPTYESFKPRGSPTYEPLEQRGSPSFEPQAQPTAQALTAAAPNSKGRSRSRKNSRSHSRSRSRSRSKDRSRSRSRHRIRDKKRTRRSSRSGSKSKSRSRSRSRHKKNSRKHRSRSRSRNQPHSSRHDRSRSRDHSRSRSRHKHKHRRRSSSHSRSRSSSRDRYASRQRGRGSSLLPFSKQERDRARAEAAAYSATLRRGKQGLGFGQSNPGMHAPAAAGQEQQQRSRDSGSMQQGRNGRDTRGGATHGSNASKGVEVLDAAQLIPGYAAMSASEKLKARMRLVMAKAEQQGAAAEAAEDAGAGRGAAGRVLGTAADASAAGKEQGWTRFVFDQHGMLDEDKQARQKLMDSEVAGGYGGEDADADVDGAGVAFVMGTGRAAAKRATAQQAAEREHEDAIFGRPFSGSGSSMHEHDTTQQNPGEGDAGTLAASLGVSDGLIAGQQQLSWRERAMAMRVKKQQS